MKLVVINKLSEEKLAELQNALSLKRTNPRKRLCRTFPMQMPSLFGASRTLHRSLQQLPESAGYTPFLTVSNVFSPRK